MKALRNSFLCLILLFGAMVLGAQAPQWQWAVQAGGMGWNEGHSIVIDSQGNQYVAGRFEYTASFGTHTLTSNGYWDIFVAKLDPSGNWLWVVQAGGEGDDSVNDIVLDASGNAYLTGYISGTATFGNHILTGSGGFVAKLDASGNWLWVVQAGGPGFNEGFGIALDGMGSIYVTGYFQGTATFGDHTLTTSGIWTDIFAAKLDPSGNWLWAVKAGGANIDHGIGIAVDGSGNAWVIGHFEGITSFGSYTLTASGELDIFVAKLDSSGDWLLAVQAGGTGYEYGYEISVDGAGNIYVTGDYGGPASFGNHSLTGNGGFVAKLDPSGNWLWAVNAGDTVSGIALDGMGNAYVTGVFYDSSTFGSHSLIANRRSNFFAAKLDPDGNCIWAVNAEGTGQVWGNSITLDGTCNAYVTGGYCGVATFGSHTLTGDFVEFDTNVFVAKLGNGTPVEDELAPQALARLHTAYPNPLGRGASALIKAEIPERSTATLSIFNLRGQVVARHKLNPGSQQISFSGEGLPAGVYLYSLQCGDYRETRKLVLLK